MKPYQEQSADSLEPWGPVLGVLFSDKSSDFVLNTLRIAGVPVDDFNLDERESYSRATRKAAYQKRLGAIYAKWNNETRLRVGANIANQLLKSDAHAKHLSDALAGVGWEIRDTRLAPLDPDQSGRTLVTSWEPTDKPAHGVTATDANPVTSTTSLESKRTPEPQQPDRRRVFVVHGRNELARRAMFTFLRSLDLDPLEWEKAVSLTGVASPSIPQVLECAFGHAWAVVVLFSGDDLARVGTRFLSDDDPPFERRLTPQSRQNVLFEAGLAFGMNPSRTVLVTIGEIRPFSDIAGRHLVRISNQAETRNTLKDRLITAGCAVNVHGKQDWLSDGDFGSAINYPDSNGDSNVRHVAIDEPTADPRLLAGKVESVEIIPIVEPKNHYLCLNLTNYTLEPITGYTVEVLTLERWSSVQGGFLKNSRFKPIRLLMSETLEPESPRLYYVAQPDGHQGFFLSGKLLDGTPQTAKHRETTEGTYRAEIVLRIGRQQQRLNLYFEWTPAQGLLVAADPEMQR